MPRPLKLVSIAHSYVVALNRRLAHELAKVGEGRWEVTAVAVSPDGQTVVTNGRPPGACCWDAVTGQPLDGPPKTPPAQSASSSNPTTTSRARCSRSTAD